MVEPVSIVPKARPSKAIQHTGKDADMHRVAAWVIDNGGRAWIVDGYKDQGPDMFHILVSNPRASTGKEEKIVVAEDWIVLLSYGNFKVMDTKEFNKTYQLTSTLKPGDERG